MTDSDPINVFIGYDKRERVAYDVCRFSMSRYSSRSLHVNQLSLRAVGPLYWRTFHMDGSDMIDDTDGRPFSTEFAFTRFLVPFLSKGMAIFCDCDFLWRADIAALAALYDPKYAVMVVKHKHVPPSGRKMDDRSQEPYPRKNWSSLVLWNCEHPAHKPLSLQDVNERPGQWLHAFSWLPDDAIGELPNTWNWLVDYTKPQALHFTSGGPWLPGSPKTTYDHDWMEEEEKMLQHYQGERQVVSQIAMTAHSHVK